MNRFWKNCAVAASSVLILAHASQAQTLVNSWSYLGGGLDPATYGGNNQPATLVPDTGFSNGATIALSGITTGGLGSPTFGPYGGIYTFFSANPSMVLSATTIMDGVDEITISFYAGDGDPVMAYDASLLTLDYNVANSSVGATSFDVVTGIVISSPLGPQNVSYYTWTWSDVSSLGVTTGFSTSWDTQGSQHVFYDDISVVQAVPEPSVLGLVVLGGALLTLGKRRRASVVP